MATFAPFMESFKETGGGGGLWNEHGLKLLKCLPWRDDWNSPLCTLTSMFLVELPLCSGCHTGTLTIS